jgi:hypothetical protein
VAICLCAVDRLLGNDDESGDGSGANSGATSLAGSRQSSRRDMDDADGSAHGDGAAAKVCYRVFG